MIQQCDFCSDIPVSAIYEAKDFNLESASMPEVIQRSEGGWAACYACEILIDGNQWDVLIRRVTTMMIFHDPILSWCREAIEGRLGRMYTELRSIGITKRTSHIS
jgi:hypothetical protein